MNKLPTDKRSQILGMMVEGMSIRAIARLTGASKNTVVKFLREAGDACAAYQDEHLRGLACKRIQVDEIWSFVGMKQKNGPAERKGEFGVGDVWTWTALDADSKLIVSWLLGDRTAAPPRPSSPIWPVGWTIASSSPAMATAHIWRRSKRRSASTSTTPSS